MDSPSYNPPRGCWDRYHFVPEGSDPEPEMVVVTSAEDIQGMDMVAEGLFAINHWWCGDDFGFDIVPVWVFREHGEPWRWLEHGEPVDMDLEFPMTVVRFMCPPFRPEVPGG